MALINKTVGAKITASLARAGYAPTIMNGVLISAPQFMVHPANGRIIEVANVVLAKTSLQSGERYLDVGPHNLAFTSDRDERDEFLDGTADSPKSWQDLVREASAARTAFALSRPVYDARNGATLSLDEIEAEAVEA